MVEPLTPVVCAESGGIDLSKPISAEQLGEIRDAYNADHVLVFRDQEAELVLRRAVRK